MLSLSACNGIFEEIYDAPTVGGEFGFVAVDDATHTGRIYIDATDYTCLLYTSPSPRDS